jgi:hypothetical protein
MYTRTASLCLVLLALGSLPAQAQGPANNLTAINARLTALEATVATLEGTVATLVSSLNAEVASRIAGDAALTARVTRLEGNITAADLVGTYRVAGIITDLDAPPAGVQIVTLSATATLLADGTGTILQQGAGINLAQNIGPWSAGVFSFPPEEILITWTYANGVVHISDGTPNLDTDLIVGAGGRVLTFSGLSDDNTVDLIIATRLQ